jgi:hypothetical protein
MSPNLVIPGKEQKYEQLQPTFESIYAKLLKHI